MFGLFQLVILWYDEVENNQPPTHAKIFYAAQGILFWSNKQSTKVIFVSLMDLEQHTGRDKKPYIWVLENLTAAYAFDYIVLWVNPGLTSCEDLATALWESLVKSLKTKQ